MNRAIGFLIGAATLISLAACGQSDATASSTVAPPSSSGRAIEGFGRALYTGDTATMVRYLEPTVAAQLTDRDRALLEGLAQTSGDVELHGFAFDVVEQSSFEISVRYKGERCGPTTHNEFPGTSVEAGPGDSGSSVSDGTIVEGDVTCVSVTDEAAKRDPFRFVRHGEEWYAKLPGLG